MECMDGYQDAQGVDGHGQAIRYRQAAHQHGVVKAGQAPDPLESGDVNSDLAVNILDIVYLINNIYKNGPAPDCP